MSKKLKKDTSAKSLYGWDAFVPGHIIEWIEGHSGLQFLNTENRYVPWGESGSTYIPVPYMKLKKLLELLTLSTQSFALSFVDMSKEGSSIRRFKLYPNQFLTPQNIFQAGQRVEWSKRKEGILILSEDEDCPIYIPWGKSDSTIGFIQRELNNESDVTKIVAFLASCHGSMIDREHLDTVTSEDESFFILKAR